MPGQPLSGVLRRLHQMLERPAVAHLGDAELLRRFVPERDEAAFAVLTQRHAATVWGVCRRILGHQEDAEDAFQATFLVLVRRAAAIREAHLVGPWLHGVACRVAAKAKTYADWRRRRERELPEVVAAADDDELQWRELRPLLDEEVNRLPERYRAPVILCYFQGKGYQEAARLLG